MLNHHKRSSPFLLEKPVETSKIILSSLCIKDTSTLHERAAPPVVSGAARLITRQSAVTSSFSPEKRRLRTTEIKRRRLSVTHTGGIFVGSGLPVRALHAASWHSTTASYYLSFSRLLPLDRVVSWHLDGVAVCAHAACSAPRFPPRRPMERRREPVRRRRVPCRVGLPLQGPSVSPPGARRRRREARART
jgi:hypothetical protein